VHERTPSELPRAVPHTAVAAAAATSDPSAAPRAPAAPGPATTQPSPAVDATRPILPRPSGHEARDVSAEELIDLEQQAEFFVVLGQDDAAIELLVAHLRDTGGASPLPYLKLLEIYRRQGDEDAYARTRERFNRRFNAHAPAWAASGQEGSSLEHYPKVLGWLQQVWSRPIDAMAVLEALLFRRDGGELFELPAYRELLFLYSLARALLEPEGAEPHPPAVDVLLPLGTEADRYEGRPPAGRRAAAAGVGDDEPSTAAGALEPSPGGSPHPGSSRFGEL
jgi:hypothetical protein